MKPDTVDTPPVPSTMMKVLSQSPTPVFGASGATKPKPQSGVASFLSGASLPQDQSGKTLTGQ